MNHTEGRNEDLRPTGVSSIDSFFEDSPIPASVALQRFNRELQDYDNSTYFTLGIPTLDSIMDLTPGELVLVGGRAASGKTAFGFQVIRNILHEQQRTGDKRSIVVFSAEMTAIALMRREASAELGIPVRNLKGRNSTPLSRAAVDAFAKGEDGRNQFLDNLFIDQSSAPTLEHMTYYLSGFHNLGLMLFDYVELAGEVGQNQQERITKITKGLKQIAKKFYIPVIALAQLNRDIEKRPDKTPLLSDFMYGGERDADLALGLMKPSLYDPAQPRELVECHIAKHRDGIMGKVNLCFDGKTMTFTEGNVMRRPLNE